MITNTNHKCNTTRRKARKVVRRWTETMSDAHLQLLEVLCTEINSDLAVRVLSLIKERNYDCLINVETDSPSSYLFASLYRDDAQIVALIKKFPHWNVTTDPKAEAMKTFIANEISCKETNEGIWEGRLHNDPVAASVFASAQRKISLLLDVAPELDELDFAFGPGSSYSVKNNTTAFDKLSSDVDVTPNCYGLARKFMLTCPGWSNNDGEQPSLRIIPGDRLAFVPKNAKTHRPIGINCLLNSVIQKGIGNALRARLKPVLNLRFAQEKHKMLAKNGSLSGEISTIDLRNASDTLSYALVQDLIPPSWFNLMDKARSQYYCVEDNWYPYHKFSAMGNGYTFELETLIFWAIADSCRDYLSCEGHVSVYGDDIICPSACSSLIIEMLALAGFRTNEQKTFVTGPFRESCGGDYFNGYDVRPFYLKDYISYRTLFLMHNFFVRNWLNLIYPKTFSWIRKRIGRENCKLFSGSSLEGDGHLLDNQQPSRDHFTISTVKWGSVMNHELSEFTKSYALYRLQFSSDFIVRGKYVGRSPRVDERLYFGFTKLKHSLRVHRHI